MSEQKKTDTHDLTIAAIDLTCVSPGFSFEFGSNAPSRQAGQDAHLGGMLASVWLCMFRTFSPRLDV